DLKPVIERTRRMYEAPESLLGVLQGAASAELIGSETMPVAAFMTAMTQVDPETIRSELSDALKESMLLVPNGCSPSRTMFPPHRRELATPVEGRLFKHRSAGIFTFGKRANCIVVGDTGVSHFDDDGVPTTVLFASCAGLLKKADGRRMLFGEELQ